MKTFIRRNSNEVLVVAVAALSLFLAVAAVSMAPHVRALL